MDSVIIPVVGMLIPIIIVPTALGLKHAKFLREVEHAERMRAMELGRTLAEDESWSPSGIAASVGTGVPIAAMFIAFIASGRPESSDVIWVAAGMIGVAGVICGSLLAAMLHKKRNQAATVSAQDKPMYDPEEFDVVGSRG